MFKRILNRFLRGTIAGSIAAMAMIIPSNISDFNGLSDWLVALLLAGIIGAITGGIMAVDKYLRDTK